MQILWRRRYCRVVNLKLPNMQSTLFNFVTWLLAFLLLNSCCSQVPKCNDCCISYKEINEPRRSVKSVWKRGQTPLCDRRILKGWYRFTSFNGTAKMPQNPVADFECGTHNPIWLRDGHPTKFNETMTSTACVSSFGNSCRYSITINVIRCPGNYFVYFLKPPSFCASAYCAGEDTSM